MSADGREVKSKGHWPLLAALPQVVKAASSGTDLVASVCRAVVDYLPVGSSGAVLTLGGSTMLVGPFAQRSSRVSAKSAAVTCQWCGRQLFPNEVNGPSREACHILLPLSASSPEANYLFAVAGPDGQLAEDIGACLSAVALVLESSLERRELQASSERRLRRLQALHDITAALSSTRDVYLQMDLLLRYVLAELKADLGAVYLLDASGQELVMAHQLGAIHRPLWRDLRFKIGQGAAGWIAEHRKPLAISDVTQDPRWVRPHPTRSEHIVSYLGVPLLAERELAGVVDVATRQRREFTEEEISFFAAAAAHAGGALLNANLLSFLRRLVENAPDIVYRVSLRPRFALEFVSPAAEAVTGYSPQELYEDPDILQKLLEPEDLQQVQRWVQGDAAPLEPVVVPLKRKDGSRSWLEFRSTPVLDRDGRVVAVEGIARDVTRQREAEEARARAYQELRRRLEQLHTLYEMAKDMTKPNDAAGLARSSLPHVQKLLAADHVLLYLAEQEPTGSTVLNLVAHIGLDDEALGHFSRWRPGDPSITGRAALTRSPVIVRSLAEFPYRPGTRRALERTGVNSLLGLPLETDGRLIGVLDVAWRQQRQPDGDTVALFETLANLLATGIRRGQLLDETLSRSQQLAALYHVAAVINRHASLKKIFDTALEQVVRILNADRGGIALADPEGTTLTVVAECGSSGPSALGKKIPASTPLERRLVRERRPVAIPDLADAADLGSAASVPLSLGIRSMLIVPIVVDDTVLGTMGIDSMRPRKFTDAEIQVAQAVAHQISASIERARLLEKEQQRVAELETLYSLSRELAEMPPDIDGVLDLIARRTLERANGAFASILLIEGGQVVCKVRHDARPLRGGFLAHQSRAFTGFPLLTRASVAREPVLARRTEALTRDERRYLFPATVQTLCIVPLRTSERLLGFLLLGEARSSQREPFGPERLQLVQGIADQAASALSRAALFHQLEESYLETVLALAKAIEAKDTYTSDHAQRISALAVAVGREMGLDERELDNLRFGAILHDIGKLAVPDAILRKPGPLDQEEWAIIRRHPAIGSEILQQVRRLQGAAAIVRHHHERFDGTGYPDGLAGEDIPLGARILCVVDAFIAMTDRRVYRAPRTPKEALEELECNAGTQFDPKVVETIKRVLSRTSHSYPELPEPLDLSIN